MSIKIKSFFILVALFSFGTLNAGVITMDGTYQGEKIVIQNPISSDNSFCITEVYVNDIPFYEINQTAFEIRLSSMNVGEYVNIKIVHKDNCRPRILNTEALRSAQS